MSLKERWAVGLMVGLLVVVFFGGMFLSMGRVITEKNACEGAGGVWHQHNCMKSEYFVDLKGKEKLGE